jgi:catalase
MTDQGIMNNTNDEAIVQAGVNPDFGVQDLYDAIAAGDYPSWTVYWQTLTPQQAENFKCAMPGLIWFLQAGANICPQTTS